MSPQSDTATDYIAEKLLYIPFLTELFSGASMSDYEVDPRQQAPRRRVIGNKILPSMRVVKANSSLVHSSNKTKKNARTVLETASGQDVSEHNIISARAHIVVTPGRHAHRRLVRSQRVLLIKQPTRKRLFVRGKKRTTMNLRMMKTTMNLPMKPCRN